MGVRYTLIDKTCPDCEKQLYMVHMKNPFLDDFEDDCRNHGCSAFGNGTRWLDSTSRSIARAEEAYEKDYNNREEE